MTSTERALLTKGVAAGTLVGLAMGLISALFLLMMLRPH
jgi:tetrahydromethanopterin S-methyltransferase subunit F